MSQAIEISIIVPIFNEEATLTGSLKALCSEISSRPGCELICVDNGSTDRSVELAQTFQKVTLLHEPKRGAYAARNRGASVAKGRILMFTDPDCIVSKGWLQAAAKALSQDGCHLALGLRRPAPELGLNRLLGDYEAAKDRWVLSSNEPMKYYGFTNNMAVTRVAWERCGPFEDRPRGSDTLFVRRLVDSAGCQAVEFVPNADQPVSNNLGEAPEKRRCSCQEQS